MTEICPNCGALMVENDSPAARLTAPGGSERIWQAGGVSEAVTRSATNDVGHVENLGIADPTARRRRESRTLPPPAPPDEFAREIAELRARLRRPVRLFRPRPPI
jgi:hypothetical protein